MVAVNNSVEKESFASNLQSETADLYTLTNTRGMSAKITTYGATLTELSVPDKRGEFKNVVLGFPALHQYIIALGYFGATIGRYANRICGGKYKLDGIEYHLYKNDGNNTLHGGRHGFDKRTWKKQFAQATADGAKLFLSYDSPDMEEGFPGNMSVLVSYNLTEKNALEIEYQATCDKPSPINLTNHSYFNLDGEPGTILDHDLRVDASTYTEVDDKLCPTGELKSVSGTPFDFKKSAKVGSRIAQTKGGYDHNFCLDHPSMDKPSVVLHSPKSGITLRMYTDQPGVQIYTCNLTTPRETCGQFHKNSALTLETQKYPDSINRPQWPNTVLKPGETYTHKVRYEFA